MLDLVTTNETAATNAKAKGGDIWAVHHNLNDTSLFSNFAKIRRIPVEAVVPIRNEIGGELHQPERLAGFNALFNSATSEVLDTRPVADSYKLVPHDELFRTQAEILADSNLPLTNLEICDRLHDGGLRAHRTIYFHDLKADIGDSTDVVRCRMDIFNSVDMSWAFQVFSGAYRDLCRNTLVFGGVKAYHQKRKHTRNLSPEALISKASMGLDLWTGQTDLMKRWQSSKITSENFAELLAGTICRKTGAAQDAGQGTQVNERLMNYLLHRFREEQAELGPTLWAAYNALTHWSTHVDAEYTRDDGTTIQTGKKTANKANVRRVRSDKVRDVIESTNWQFLEHLAA